MAKTGPSVTTDKGKAAQAFYIENLPFTDNLLTSDISRKGTMSNETLLATGGTLSYDIYDDGTHLDLAVLNSSSNPSVEFHRFKNKRFNDAGSHII